MPKYARKTPSTRLPELIKTGKIKGNSGHLLTNGNSSVLVFEVGVETAHSLPPESAGSRSPERRRQGIDAVSTGSAQPVFACGVLILLNCRHGLCCTAEW
jgi:hypothetical protein